MGTDVGELVHDGAAADNRPVVHLSLAGDAHIAHEDAVVADAAVVRDVHVRHNQGVAADLGHALAARLGAAVDGGALADGDVVANLHIGHFALKLQILRHGAHDGSRENLTAAAHSHIRVDGRVRMNLAVVADYDIVIDEGVWAYFNVFAQLRVGAYGC